MRLIAGPCVLQRDGQQALTIARHLRALSERLGGEVTFKASFDKANRTRADSFRGPGLARGLELLAAIGDATGLPILTDIHEPWQAERAAEVAHTLQIPAFLSRQTDLITAAARTGRALNLKKGQFMAPDDVVWAVDKARRAGATEIAVTERGVSFGYRDLIVDPRSLARLLELGRRHDFEVVFDGTHSVQRPSAEEGRSGGERRYVAPLVRAAAAIGVRRFFLETWLDPDDATASPCDGPNALPLEAIEPLLLVTRRIIRALDPKNHAETTQET